MDTFFTASKIFWILIAPANFLALCLIACFLAGRAGMLRLSFWLLLMSTFTVAGLGIMPTGHNAVAWLEKQTERPKNLPDEIAGIIVLGGIFDPELTRANGVITMYDTAERIMEALTLSGRYPEAKLIFSGGTAALDGKGIPETEIAKIFINKFNKDSEQTVFEGKSRNTKENAAFTFRQLNPKAGENWILVTSAYHMPRAIQTFKTAGWKNISPWPVDYKTDGKFLWTPREFDVLGGFYLSHLAVKELVGILAYNLARKIEIHNAKLSK